MPMSTYYRRLRDLIGTRRIFTPAVVALIRNADGEILCVQEQGQQNYGLPAGAIELGETPAEAVVREVYEETGLQVEPTAIIGIFGGSEFRWTYPDGNQVEYLIVVFACTVRAGTLSPIDGEIQA